MCVLRATHPRVQLLLIRHGLPVRVEHDDGTAADPPLSDAGVDQAARLARWLAAESIDHIVASPLLRARETAAPLASDKGLEVEIEPATAKVRLGYTQV